MSLWFFARWRPFPRLHPKPKAQANHSAFYPCWTMLPLPPSNKDQCKHLPSSKNHNSHQCPILPSLCPLFPAWSKKRTRMRMILRISGTKDSQASGRKKKRHRTTPEQLRTLEETYEREKMPNQELRERLAKKLGMTPRRVQIWFQNKRAKEKRSKPSPRSSLQMHHHQPPSTNPAHVNSSEFMQQPSAHLINAYFAPDLGRYMHTPSPFVQGPLNPTLLPSLFSASRPIQNANTNSQTQLPGPNHDLMVSAITRR